MGRVRMGKVGTGMRIRRTLSNFVKVCLLW